MRVPDKIIQQFKQQAKAAFPRETFAYLIGIDAGTSVEVEDLYVPDNVDDHCGYNFVTIQPHWEIEAMEHARDDGRDVLGDIHSHPYTAMDGVTKPDRAQSEADMDCNATGLCGICTVVESRSGRLRASVRFWGPTTTVETVII